MAGYAEAIADFLDSMRFRQVDLLGVHVGAGITAELAIARAKVVRRVVMIGVPVLDADDRKSYRDLSAPEGLSPGATWARATLADWQGESRLKLVKQPLLVLRPKDAFWDGGGRIASLLPAAKVVDLAEQDKRILESQPALVAKHVVPFLA
jgi:pimeloyl-ACP methyl ester carboxylesterase